MLSTLIYVQFAIYYDYHLISIKLLFIVYIPYCHYDICDIQPHFGSPFQCVKNYDMNLKPSHQILSPDSMTVMFDAIIASNENKTTLILDTILVMIMFV